MITLNFGLFWSGSKLSYLRYLTFKTLRHFHPDAPIQLYVANECKKDGYKWWGGEKQDFESELEGKDYLEELGDLDVEIIHTDKFSGYLPTFQSDFFRWWYLKNNGGWYLDTDQIILKSFKTLPLDCNLICSIYPSKSCGTYSPVGCIGATKDSEVVQWIDDLLPQFYKPDNYNCLGPFMFLTVIQMRKWKDRIVNAPPNIFYPVPDSYLVPTIYDGSLQLTDESFCLHEFGGHSATQEFNKKYTKEFAKTSNDTISRFLREKEII